MMNEQNRAYLRVTGELLQGMFFTKSKPDTWWQVQYGIPEDAKFIRMSIDESFGRSDMILVYEHESFPKSRPGQPLPELPSVIYQNINITLEEAQEAFRRRAVAGCCYEVEEVTKEQMDTIRETLRLSNLGCVQFLPDAIGKIDECHVVTEQTR